MEQFVMVALAHFMALLLPGPDFFLIVRTAIRSGWRSASGTCLGITLANGVFIACAFSGVSVFPHDSSAMLAVQWAGLVYLFYLGLLFMRSARRPALDLQVATSDLNQVVWGKALGMGFVSGVLNPKNALFYVSLAAALAEPIQQASIAWLYGLWMVSVVFLWDLSVAVFLGNQFVLRRFAAALPYLEFIAGGILITTSLAIAGWSLVSFMG